MCSGLCENGRLKQWAFWEGLSASEHAQCTLLARGLPFLIDKADKIKEVSSECAELFEKCLKAHDDVYKGAKHVSHQCEAQAIEFEKNWVRWDIKIFYRSLDD